MNTFIIILIILFALGLIILNTIMVLTFFKMSKNVASILGYFKSYFFHRIINNIDKWLCPGCGNINSKEEKYCINCNKSSYQH